MQDGDRSDLAEILGPLSRGVDYTDWTILYMIPIFGRLKWLADGYKNLKFVYTVFHNGWVHLEEEFNKFKKNVAKAFKDLITPNVSGTYFANTDGMLSFAFEVEQIERGMLDVASDITSIERTLLYDSICGSYAKARLKLIVMGINNDARKTLKAANIISNCARRYNRADRAAQDHFGL